MCATISCSQDEEFIRDLQQMLAVITKRDVSRAEVHVSVVFPVLSSLSLHSEKWFERIARRSIRKDIADKEKHRTYGQRPVINSVYS